METIGRGRCHSSSHSCFPSDANINCDAAQAARKQNKTNKNVASSGDRSDWEHHAAEAVVIWQAFFLKKHLIANVDVHYRYLYLYI